MRLNKFSVQVSISALLVALSAVASTAQTESLRNLSNIQIDNFGRINDAYFRGAQPRGQDYADLAALGVKTVIDLTQDGDVNEPGIVRSAKMKFYRIPMTTHVPPTSAQIGEFLTIVNDQANWPVYVHCQGGRHRTGVMTAVYRMMKDGWKPDQAFREMKQYKYGPDFLHPEFKSFVYDYYTERDRWPTTPAPVIATSVVVTK